MDPAVVQQHIDLYVNDYSLNLDERAVERLIALGEQAGLYAPSGLPRFAYPRP